jgi:hypothetical protein
MDNNILLSINFLPVAPLKKNAEITRLLWEPLESLLFLLLSTIFWMVFLSDDYLGESLLEV